MDYSRASSFNIPANLDHSELDEIQSVWQDLRLFCYFYLNHNYNSKLALDYQDQVAAIASFFFPAERPIHEYFKSLNAFIGYDICTTCAVEFGITYGGRLRFGCTFCKDRRGNYIGSRSPDTYYINRIAYQLGIAIEALEVAFSEVYHDIRISKSPPTISQDGRTTDVFSPESETTISQLTPVIATLSPQVPPLQTSARPAEDSEH